MILRSTILGEGPPVVLMHGLFGQARNFAGVQRQLADTFKVVALDLRNHGGSPHGTAMDYRSMAGDVLQTLSELGLPPCPLIGHSMGGKTAMAAALLAPARVSRLIVVDVAPVRYPPHFDAIIAVLRGLKLTAGLTRAAADAALAEVEPDPGTRGFLLSNLQLGAAPSWRIGLDEIAAAMLDISDWPFTDETYPGPTLFILGAKSRYVRAEHRPMIQAHFPRARFVSLKNAGHWVHADDPEGFLAVLRAALALPDR